MSTGIYQETLKNLGVPIKLLNKLKAVSTGLDKQNFQRKIFSYPYILAYVLVAH